MMLAVNVVYSLDFVLTVIWGSWVAVTPPQMRAHDMAETIK